MTPESHNSSTISEYLQGEVEFVRKSYLNGVDDIRKLERYIVVIVAAVWSWCAGNLSSPALPLIAWVPFAAAVLFGLRAWSISVQVQSMRRYLAKVESHLDLPGQLGWERNRAGTAVLVRVATGWLFWALVQVASLGVALYVCGHAAHE